MNAARKLALIYLILVGLKIVGSFFIVTPTIYSDEYIYAKTARSIATSFEFTIHEMPTNQYAPLYALMISPAYLFQDMNTVYLIMKIINALLATLIIIPAYLFAKEFVSTRESITIAALVAVLPPTFAFTSYIMAENLFYPIFLTALYYIYKAQQEKTIKYNVLAGIAIGAAILTRIIGVTLLGIVGLLFLRSLFTKHYEEIKNKSILGIITLATLALWMIRNILAFGFSTNSIIGSYSREIGNTTRISFEAVLGNGMYWTIAYVAMIILSSGILFALGTLLFIKEEWRKKKNELVYVVLSTLIVVVIVAVNHQFHGLIKAETFLQLMGRPIGRYMDIALPLIIIAGYIGLSRQAEVGKKWFISLGVITLLGAMIMFFPLVPVNNMSLAWLGVIQQFLSVSNLNAGIGTLVAYMLAIVVAFLAAYLVWKKTTRKNMIKICTIFFLVLSLGNIAIAGYNSQKNWLPLEQVQLGKWIDNNTPPTATIMFDEKGCLQRSIQDNASICSSAKDTTLAGFWINRKIRIGNNPLEADYFISRAEVNYTPIYQTESNIYVYQVN